MGAFKDLKAQDVKEAREATGLGLMAIKAACKKLDTDDAILAGFYADADCLAVSIKPKSARHTWNLDRAKEKKEKYLLTKESAKVKKLKNMSKDERSLLLFFESNAVDHRGKISVEHMNDEDHRITEAWDKEKFIRFGRVALADIITGGQQPVRPRAHWVTLSDKALSLAQEERRARIKRMVPYGEGR